MMDTSEAVHMTGREECSSGGDGQRFSRREVLRRGGLSLAVGGAGVVAVPSAPRSHVHAEPETGGESVRPETEPVPEDETPFGVWHYKPVDGEMYPTAPINVVCPLDEAAFDQLVSVFRRVGLRGPPLEYVRYAWDRDARRYRRQRWTAAETFAGISGRFHVRCWKLTGTASVQAHLDTPATPKHGIESYARARDAVGRIFREAGWDVADASLHLGNDKGPDHDGRATVVRR